MSSFGLLIVPYNFFIKFRDKKFKKAILLFSDGFNKFKDGKA